MADRKLGIILRMGSHSEKEYLKKTLRFFDGIVIGANLVEATPGATASLLVRLCGKKIASSYFIDPMTYAFGCYIDPSTGSFRKDMDWIKSDQIKKKKTIRTFKRSYAALADKFGGIFSNALSRGTAVMPSDFGDAALLENTCKAIVDYQMTRIASEFQSDQEYKNFAKDVPLPQVVFAPYFYIEPNNPTNWLDLNITMAATTARLKPQVPVHAVICFDESFLENQEFLGQIISRFRPTGVQGVWFWISRFQEDRASTPKLRGYRKLIEELSTNMEVYSMHGGYYSMALGKYGLRGTSHGIGYGEQKDVVPVIGQSTPTVRYYLRPVRKRLSVVQIERCFDALGITDPPNFYSQICDCAVCKGVVVNSLKEFSSFGDMRLSTPVSKRFAQTPAAAKRCRYHFLLNRVKEGKAIEASTIQNIVTDLRTAYAKWVVQPTLQNECGHLERWAEVLG